jgi:alkane 1-monooxygenase
MLTNSVLQGIIVECIILVLIIIFFGWVAVVIFLYQAYSAVRLLETINYYQHWGLQQGKSQNNLAWVNKSQVTEYALLGISNHIEHHKNAKTPFYQTNYSNSGPIMKYGYFVTNLWVKLNNASYRKDCMGRLKNL